MFTADDAVAWSDRGEPVILVRRETVPDDIHGMWVAQGVLTATGGMTSHAAVVGRQMGKPSVVGAGELVIDEHGKTLRIKDQTLKEGDFLSFDGLTGEVKIARVASQPSEILQVVAGKLKASESPIFERFNQMLTWSDKFRRLGVRANADLPDQAELAYAFGARGIGLCRTEHMFFGEGRIPIVQRMILADNEADRRAALDELLPLQREDFYGVFKAMKGEAVTIRTIDPPLHEFLPKREELMVEIAKLEATRGDAQDHRRAQEAAGSRRATARVQPDARPSRRAPGHHLSRDHRDADARHHGGGVPVEPGRAEGRPRDHDSAGRPREGAARPEGRRRIASPQQVMTEKGVKIKYLVGTMIEVPRGALTADQIAAEAQFFSFGTNDLTQMAFGFSRDDIGKFLRVYQDKKILDKDPFATIDVEGVGALVRIGVEKGRAARPDLKIGICGEHGGDPASVHFFESVKLDYVSASPYRIPVARLAAAQAALHVKVGD